jgi:predicted nucleotidyltransferase
MHRTTDESAHAAAADFARCIVPFWQAELGSELLGAYLIGSLAHGGFSRRYSDIDMALVTEAGLSPERLDRVRSQAAALSTDWGAKLSVFWTDRHFGIGRFPPLDRIDYIDHAVVLMERECVRPVRPTLEEIQHYLAGAPFASWIDRARRFATAETLEPKNRKLYLRTLLYPGRFCYSWMTGRMVGASSVVLSTDLGQPNNPLHPDGLLAFYKGLIAQGISEADIVQMSQTNPAKLLGLKP